MDQFKSIEEEIVAIRKDISRIFDHHEDYKEYFLSYKKVCDNFMAALVKEEKERIAGDIWVDRRIDRMVSRVYKGAGAVLGSAFLGLVIYIAEKMITQNFGN